MRFPVNLLPLPGLFAVLVEDVVNGDWTKHDIYGSRTTACEAAGHLCEAKRARPALASIEYRVVDSEGNLLDPLAAVV